MVAAAPLPPPTPDAGPTKRRWRRVWYVARWWLVLLLAAGGLFSLQAWANHDRDARIRQSREHASRRSDFSYRVRSILSSGELSVVEAELNKGAPLPRNRTVVGRIYQADLPGANLHERYAPFHATLTFNDQRPLAARIFAVSAPPRDEGPIWIWAGKLRHWTLYAAGVVAVISFLLMPFAGLWRRSVAQVCIGASLLAALAVLLHPLVNFSWRRPSVDVIALGVAALMVLCCLIGLLIPVRRPVSSSSRCRSCGYDLTGNESGICPECGTPILSPEQLERQKRSAELAQALEHTEITSAEAAEPS